MPLSRLIYASTLSESFDYTSIESILSEARSNNQKQNVTGVLYFSNQYFLQCLEGARANINDIYKRILSDNRHDNIEILRYEEVDERAFSNWTMGYVPSSNLSSPIVLKFSGGPDFNPYIMSGQSAYMMLLELKKWLPMA